MDDISKFDVNGTVYSLKDEVARKAAENIPTTVATAVEQYLTENPPSGTVSTEEIKAAVTEYLTANPPSGVTETDIVNAVNSYMEANAESFKGENGVTPNLTIGTVETLAAGSSATAEITGTAENPVLSLGIPQGAKGKDGASGSGGSAYYYKPVVIATTAGKYWKKDGTLGDSTEETDTYIKKVSATNLEQYLPVSEGEVYRVTLGSIAAIPVSFNSTQCVFLNNDDEFVANAFDTLNYKENELVTVPEGATKMHFTIWSGSVPKIEKQTTEPYGVINKVEHMNYLNRVQKEQQTFGRKTFAPFDKAYITFVNDDCRGVVSEIVDVLTTKGVPLCLAAIYSNFNNLANSGVVLDAVRKAVENGGEVLSHAPNPITENEIDNFDKMYEQFAKSKEMLQLYGFDVNGIILAGGNGQIVGSDKTDKWARAYYQYSDLYGNENYGYPYYHYRTALSNLTLDKAKKAVDDAIASKGWTIFYLHEWSEFSQADMESLLDYINEKDSRELEVATYKQVYDKFCTAYPKKIVTIAADKTSKVFATGSDISTNDITVKVYYSDGSTEETTSGITVDISSIDTTTAGNYYMGVSYGGKTAYIPIEIYASGERAVLYSGKEGSYITWELYTDGVLELTNTATWKQNIQNYVDGSQPWYEHMSLIKKVKINAGNYGIGTIGEYAFYGATNLTEFESLMDGEITLSAYTFGNCGFTTPIINGIYTVQTNAFNGCPITEITLGASVVSYNAFGGCSDLTVVRFTKDSMSIDGGAFNANKGVITDIYVPWEEGAVANAPWGATGATIHYDYTE